MKKKLTFSFCSDKKNKNLSGFTLIEILVAIAIIAIIALGTTSINFNSLNDRQKVDIFMNKIITNFEEVRNNSLLGKGVGSELDNPIKWRIEFSTTGSGNIKSSYLTGATSSWIQYNENVFENFFKIKKIECLSLDESDSIEITGVGIIEVEGSKLTLTGACNSNPNYRKLKTTIGFKNQFEKVFEINVVNGLINTLK